MLSRPRHAFSHVHSLHTFSHLSVASLSSPSPGLATTLGLALEEQAEVAAALVRVQHLHQAVALLGQVHRDVATTACTTVRDLFTRIIAAFLHQVRKKG